MQHRVKDQKRFDAIDKLTTQPLKSFIDRIERIPTNIFVGFNQYLSISTLLTYPRNLIHSHHSVTTKQEKN